MKVVFRTVLVLIYAGSLLSILPARVPGGETIHPFIPGEKLTFVLKWGAIGAGEAVLRVLPMKKIDGQEAYHFEVTARSSKTIDRIFRIRDRMESNADRKMTHSLLYKQKIREGGYKKDRVITFDWEQQTLAYVSGKGAPKPLKVMPGTFDPLSAFYFVRLQPLEAGQSIERPITDGKKNVVGRVNVLRRDKVQVDNRIYDAFELEPILDDVELFNADKDSSVRIWVSADKRRLPLLIKSKITLGEFRAELKRIEYIQPPRPPDGK